MCCVVEWVRKLRVRQKVLGLNLTHRKSGLQDLKIFFVPRVCDAGLKARTFRSPFRTGTKAHMWPGPLEAHSQPGVKPICLLVGAIHSLPLGHRRKLCGNQPEPLLCSDIFLIMEQSSSFCFLRRKYTAVTLL